MGYMPTEDQINTLQRFYFETVEDQGYPPARARMLEITGIRDDKALDIALRIIEFRRAVQEERLLVAARTVGKLRLDF